MTSIENLFEFFQISPEAAMDPTETVVSAPSLLPQWMHDAGSIASIVSFFISAYAAIIVRNIAKHYRQIALAPKIKSNIRTRLKNLDSQLQAKDWQRLKTEAAGVAGDAAQAQDVAFGNTRKSAKSVYTLAKRITQSTMLIQTDAEKLIAELTEFDVHISYFIENKKWQ